MSKYASQGSTFVDSISIAETSTGQHYQSLALDGNGLYDFTFTYDMGSSNSNWDDFDHNPCLRLQHSTTSYNQTYLVISYYQSGAYTWRWDASTSPFGGNYLMPLAIRPMSFFHTKAVTVGKILIGQIQTRMWGWTFSENTPNYQCYTRFNYLYTGTSAPDALFIHSAYYANLQDENWYKSLVGSVRKTHSLPE